MNGAVYISFFQGQLESVLEQVVQFAVQEISTTVGSSLNALLLETTVKEQENQRLRVQLQSQEKKDDVDGVDGGGGTGSAIKRCEEEAVQTGGTKPEHRQQQQRRQQRVHAPGGRSTEFRCHTDTRRLEQRGRVVGQLKFVMEKVLNFAVCELTKIVEASFDDLLLEITKMETEHQILEEKLDKKSHGGGGGGGGGVAGKRRGSENDSVSPSGSEDAREDLAEVAVVKEKTEAGDSQRSPVLSVSQEWFPILDKVFGQKWCSDVLQIKELAVEGGGRGEERAEPPITSSVTLEPAPSSPQQDPRWTPLEDMEVFSPDQITLDDTADSLRNLSGPSHGPALSPTTNLSQAAEAQLPGEGSCGRRSSASMLHRLLTLPSQLLEEDDGGEAGTADSLVTLGGDGPRDAGPEGAEAGGPKDEEDEGGEEDKGRKKKRRRVWSECDECGRSFSRMSLLKAHRQTHLTETTAIADGGSSASPHASAPSPLSCSNCGKRFSSVTRLHSHVHTQHPAQQS